MVSTTGREFSHSTSELPHAKAHTKGTGAHPANGGFVLQANWPNFLNYSEESAFAGQSRIVSRAGEVLAQLPTATAGIGLVSLADTGIDWLPQDA